MNTSTASVVAPKFTATVLAVWPSSSDPCKSYEIRMGKDGNVYCTCAAWRFQRKPVTARTCKHLQAFATKAFLPKAG
jgi:hypothetical protein